MFSGALLAFFPFFAALRGVVCKEASVSALKFVIDAGYASNSPAMIFSITSA
jgi:hypothetical protein